MTSTVNVGTAARLFFKFVEADLVANNAEELIAPEDGYIAVIDGSVQKAVTTGGTLTVKTGAALATTVGTIAATVANGATKGTRLAGVLASVKGDATRFVTKGTRIAIQPASFATAGAIQGYLVIQSADI